MKHVYAVLLTSMSLLLYSSKSFSQVNVGDSMALVDLYNNTDGPHWGFNGGWLTKRPVRKWDGIIVTDNRVTTIALSQNYLTGELTPSIGNLTALNFLYLNSNALTGRIPRELGNIKSLLSVLLNYNQLTGEIPESLDSLPVVQNISLAYNQLTGTIPYLGSLQNLEGLSLNNNQLTGTLPSFIGNFRKLISLSVGTNFLTGEIPSEINSLKKLQFINVGGNLFSGNFPAFDAASELRSVSGNGNLFTGSLPEFVDKPLLVAISLSYKKFTGNIPYSYGFLPLNGLFLSNNNLNTIPTSLILLKQYSSGELQNNKLNFDSLEIILPNLAPNVFLTYSPQAILPLSNSHGDALSVSAGGTLSNNTYSFYRNNNLYRTIVGDSTFIPDLTGSYFVRVTNSVVSNLILNSDTITINEPCVLAPVNTVTSNVQSNSATLSWYASPGAIRYQVRYKAGNGTFTTVNTNNNSITLTGLLPNTKYTWKARAICSESSSPYTANVVFRTTNSLTLSESTKLQIKQGSITISPNPATSYADISFIASTQADYSIKLYDMQERLLQVKTSASVAGKNNVRLLIGNITKGMYLVRVTCGNQSYVSKLVKQ